MALKIKIGEVTVEHIVKGKSRYSVANVVHTYNGESRTQKIMSFANPQVFERVQKLNPGDMVEVTITKNDAGYNQWSAINKVADDGEESAPAEKRPDPKSGTVAKGSWETAEERAARQVLIVKQSCLAQAINYLSAVHQEGEPSWNVNNVLEVAQEFTDWVFGKNEPSLMDMESDSI
jgi:uncharacterized protein (DUF1501 family)